MSCFQEAEKNGAVLYLDMAFAALTPDVISSYCRSRYWKFLEDGHVRNNARRAAENTLDFAHIHRFFPRLTYIWIMAPSLPGDIFEAHARKLGAVSISRAISDVFNCKYKRK